ncbi:hypothetical protein LTR10_015712 [Elasticomyces elasticus]|nr:hypothetical protein LTR10_015712 [Elasticomyces elasticus]KAK4975456.1 hypothetical protein LTR42_004667 [Elasticomyces elasticus]
MPCSACAARGHPKDCDFVTEEGSSIYTPIQQSYEIRQLRLENQQLKERLNAVYQPNPGDETDIGQDQLARANSSKALGATLEPRCLDPVAPGPGPTASTKLDHSPSDLRRVTAAASFEGERKLAVGQALGLATIADTSPRHTITSSSIDSSHTDNYSSRKMATHKSTDPTSYSREQSSKRLKMQAPTIELIENEKMQDELVTTVGDHDTIRPSEEQEANRMTVCTGSVAGPQPHTLASKHRLATGFVDMFREDATLMQLDVESGMSVAKACPRLLKAYALMLRSSVKIDLEKQAYLFVRQQRKLIVRCLESMLVSVDDEAQGPRLANLASPIPPQEKVHDWLGRLEFDTAQHTSTATSARTDEGGNPNPLPGGHIDPVSRRQLGDDVDVWSDTSVRAQADEEANATLDSLVPRLKEVTDFLTNNIAWDWLKSRLQASSRWTHWPHEILELIMDTIGEPEYPGVTGLLNRYDFDIAVCWNPREYLDDYYDASNNYRLEDTIVLTGEGELLEASICGTYLQTMWPWAGVELVRALQLALWDGLGLTTCDTVYHVLSDSEITFEQRYDVLHACIRAPIPAVVEIAEQLAFMGGACTASAEGVKLCNRKAKCRASSTFDTFSTNGLHQMDITYEDGPVQAEARCWDALFRNPCIASNFPARLRDQKFKGMEMSGDIMIKLGDLLWATVYANRFMLKGFSSLFYPVMHDSRATVWHFVCNAEGSYLPYAAARDSCLDGDALDRRELLGTRDCDYAALQHPSNLSMGSNLVLEKVTLSGSKYLGLSLTFSQGNHHRGVFHSGTSSYVRMILHARKMFTVCYDTITQRAYLSDGASAVLHVTCAQLNSPDMERFSEANVREQFTYAVPGSPEGCVDALLNNGNRRLVIDKDETEYTQEVTQLADGLRIKHAAKAKIVYWCVRDLIMENCERFLKLWERQAEVSSGLDIRLTHRVRLEGWSLKSVIDGSIALEPKLVYLKTNGRGWVSLAKQLNAVTLMGTGLGPLIRPRHHSCPPWSTMPKGQDYLACQVSTLKEIALSRGDMHGIPIRLTSTIRWQPGKSLFEHCSGTGKAHHNCCDRIQELSTNKGFDRSPSSLFNIMMNDANRCGAVFLGHGVCPILPEDFSERLKADEGYASLSPSTVRSASSSDRTSYLQASGGISEDGGRSSASLLQSDAPSSSFSNESVPVSRVVSHVEDVLMADPPSLHEQAKSGFPQRERFYGSQDSTVWNGGLALHSPQRATQRAHCQTPVQRKEPHVREPCLRTLRHASKSRILRYDNTP